MSNIGYKPIKDAIVAKLNTLVPTTLSAVYGKDIKSLGGVSPTACVYAKGHDGIIYTVGSGGSNDKTYEHYIKIYFRIDETNNPDYEDNLETVADAVISTLEHDTTLGNVVDWSLPLKGTWDFGELEVPVRFLELVLPTRGKVTR